MRIPPPELSVETPSVRVICVWVGLVAVSVKVPFEKVPWVYSYMVALPSGVSE